MLPDIVQLREEREQALARSQVRTRLLQHLETALYGKYVEKRFFEKKKLIQRNSQFHHNDQQCMRVGSEVWGYEVYRQANVPLPREINPIHPDLQEQLDAFLAEESSQEAKEYRLVMGSIRTIITATPSFKDYEAIFPTKLHNTLRYYKAEVCYRDREEHHLNPAQLEQLKVSQEKYLHLMKILMTRHLLNLS